jgi:hypothetical protein
MIKPIGALSNIYLVLRCSEGPIVKVEGGIVCNTTIFVSSMFFREFVHLVVAAFVCDLPRVAMFSEEFLPSLGCNLYRLDYHASLEPKSMWSIYVYFGVLRPSHPT